MTEKSKDKVRAVSRTVRKQYIAVIALLVALFAVILVIILSSGRQLAYADTPTIREEIELRIYDYLRTGDGKEYGIAEATDEDTVLGFGLEIAGDVFSDAGITVTDEETERITVNMQAAVVSFAGGGILEEESTGVLTGLSQAYIASGLADAVENALTGIDMSESMGNGSRYTGLSSSYMSLMAEIDEEIRAVNDSTGSVNEIYAETAEVISGGETTYNVDPDSYVDGETFNSVINALRVELLAEITENSDDITEIYNLIDQINEELSNQLTLIQEAVDNISVIMGQIEELQTEDSDINQKIVEINNTIASIQENISTACETLETNIVTTKEELQQLITATDASIRQSLEETNTQLNQYIDEVDTALREKITEMEEQNAADLEETRRLIAELTEKEQTDYDQLTADITEKYEELNTKIEENCEELRQSLEQATEEQKQALEEAVTNLEQEISDTTTMLETEINDLSDTLNTRIDETTDELMNVITGTALTLDTKIEDVRTELTESLNQLSLALDEFKALYEANLAEVWAAINQNAADIAANAADIAQLQTQLATFMASSDSHQKVDVIEGFTISAGSWTVSSGYASYVVYSDYLVDCTVATVNFAQQYDITPTYSLDPSAGTLTISIPSTQKADIEISGIVVYHVYADTPEEEEGISTASEEWEEETGSSAAETGSTEAEENGSTGTEENGTEAVEQGSTEAGTTGTESNETNGTETGTGGTEAVENNTASTPETASSEPASGSED